MIRFIFVLLIFFTALLCGAAGEPTDADRQRNVVERFWTLLEKTPRRGTALDRVYGYHVDTGEIDELLDRCRRRTETDPADADAWLLLGLVQSRSGDEGNAVTSFEKTLSRQPGNLHAALYLGEIHLAQGRLQKAAEVLGGAASGLANVEKAPKDLLVVLQMLGRVYERFGDRPNAARVWNRLEELFPDDTDIRLRIAETLEEEGKWDDALARYEKLAKETKEPFDRVRFALSAAEIKIRKGERSAAVTDFERLLDGLSGESWLAETIRDRLERVYVRSADYVGLDEYYKKRLEKYPDELDTVRRRAVTLVRLSKSDEAKTLLTETLRRAPSNVPLRLALVDLLVAEKDFQAASEQYAEIDRLEPNFSDHLTQWGLVTLEDTKLDETERKTGAAKIWNKILAAKPSDVTAVVAVADLMNAAGIEAEAETLYKKAVELKPNDPGYLEYLAYFYHHRQRKDEAVATLRKIGHLAGTHRLAGTLRALGYTAEAAEAYREAVTHRPDDFDLRMQYAQLLVDADEYEKAAAEYAAIEKLLDTETPTEQTARFLNDYVKLYNLAGTPAPPPAPPPPQTTVDFWRLALLESAQGRSKEAVEAIDQALLRAPNSPILMDAASKIFLQASEKQRAVELCEKLAETDSARRVDHLRRLANLHRELGDTDKALEAAKLAMAVGAGNPAHARFYAEMLLAAKRQREAVEVLRRAVRLDPGDEITLNMLAGVLFETDRVDEAIELTWRVFEKTDDLQGKLGVVSRLTTFYRKTKKFATLLDRLRMSGRDAASHRESVFCTAQVHVTEADYGKARTALESLLFEIDEKKTDDLTLLSQLSRITELQNDIPAAVRYQELLCEKTTSIEEASRLLTLYRLGGERDKPVDHLLRALAEKGKPHEQLHAVDDFLAREEYVSARRLLDRMALKRHDDWEVLYRRLMLDFWQGHYEAAQKHAETLLALTVDRNEPSERKRHEKPVAPNAPPTGIPVLFGSSQGAWQFGQNRTISLLEAAPLSTIQQQWSQTNSILIQTIHREKLEYSVSNLLSHKMTGTPPQPQPKREPPPKPLFVPDSFGEARLAAMAWLLRIVTDENVSKTLADLRRTLPENDSDADQLTERLRFETFLQQMISTANQNTQKFRKTDYATLFMADYVDDSEAKKEAPACLAAGRQRRNKIAYELALRGRTEWYPTAFREVLKDLYTEHMLRNMPDIEPGGDVERRFEAALKSSLVQEICATTDIQRARNVFFKTLRNLAGTPAHGSTLRNGQRLELLRRCWDEIERGTFEQRSSDGTDLYLLLSEYPLYVQTLRMLGLDEELDRSRDILKNLSKRITWCRAVYANITIAELYEKECKPESLSSLIDLVRLHFTEQHGSKPVMFPLSTSVFVHGVWYVGPANYGLGRVSIVYDFVKWHEDPITAGDDNIRYEKFLAFLTAIRDDVMADQPAAQKSGNVWMSNTAVPHPEAQFDAFFAKYLEARLRPLRNSLTRQQGVQRYNSFTVIGGILVPFEAGSSAGSTISRTVDAETLAAIAAAEKEIYRVLDAYFDIMEYVAESDGNSERKPTDKRKLLTRYQRTFDVIDEAEDSLRRSRTGSTSHATMNSPEMLMIQIAAFFKEVDDFLFAAKIRGDIDTEKVHGFHLAAFDTHLMVRSQMGTDAENAHIARFRMIHKNYVRRPVARYGDEPEQAAAPVRNVIEALEHEVQRARENGEQPDPRDLVMLAIQEKRRSRFEKAVEYLDAVPLDNDPEENRLREYWVLRMFVLGAAPETLKHRAKRAIERLSHENTTAEELLALQKTQQLLGQNDEAEKSRDRMMEQHLAGQMDAPTLHKLLEDFRARKESRNPKVVAFAEKVFWEPRCQTLLAEQNRDSIPVRESALNILIEAGKLGELIEHAEAKVLELVKDREKQLPAMISLSELYFRADYRGKLEAMAKQIDKRIGGPLKDAPAYMNHLEVIGMRSQVSRWRHQMETKSLEERLAQYDDQPYPALLRLSELAYQCKTYGLTKRLVEILCKNDSEALAKRFDKLNFQLELWLDRSETREATRNLLQKLWSLEKTDEKSRREIRLGIVSQISHRTRFVEYYPMFRDVLFDFIQTDEPERYETPKGNRLFEPFRATVWGLDRAFSMSTTFLDLAGSDGRLDELSGELRKMLDTPLSRKGEASARLLLAMTEARQGRAEAAIKTVRKLHALRDSDPAACAVFLSGNFMLAQELVALNDPAALDLAAKAFEQELIGHQFDKQLERVVKVFREMISKKRNKP